MSDTSTQQLEADRIAADLEQDIETFAVLDDPWENEEYENLANCLEITRELHQYLSNGEWSTTAVTYCVLLGTGGPAYGINFTDEHAEVWHQDWGTLRVPQSGLLSERSYSFLTGLWMLEFDIENLNEDAR